MTKFNKNRTNVGHLILSLVFLFVFAGADSPWARSKLFSPEPITGYALGGHDPVAYFVNNKPVLGNRKHEMAWAGVEWIFANEGNMAAFKDAPEVYAPLFGGCGAYALSEGFSTAGNPKIFAFIDGKLALFHSIENRFLFLVNASQSMSDAAFHAQKTGCKPKL